MGLPELTDSKAKRRGVQVAQALALVGGLVGSFTGEGATPFVVARRLLFIPNVYKATV